MEQTLAQIALVALVLGSFVVAVWLRKKLS
jgi:hypothetical protein